jgi:hypothetical protein
MDAGLFALHHYIARFAGESASCGTKIRHPTEEKARKRAEAFTLKKTDGKMLREYPCPFCGEWHIGANS